MPVLLSQPKSNSGCRFYLKLSYFPLGIPAGSRARRLFINALSKGSAQLQFINHNSYDFRQKYENCLQFTLPNGIGIMHRCQVLTERVVWPGGGVDKQ